MRMICGAAGILAFAEEVSVRVMFRRSYIGVCRGGVCESALCRRNYIGVCRGGVCGVICVAAVLLVFAEEVSVCVCV